MNPVIRIELKPNEQVTLTLPKENIPFSQGLRALATTIQKWSENVIEMNPGARPVVFDALNVLFTNILDAIQPERKADLDEKAILALENQIIWFAKDKGWTLDKALTLLKEGKLHVNITD